MKRAIDSIMVVLKYYCVPKVVQRYCTMINALCMCNIDSAFAAVLHELVTMRHYYTARVLTIVINDASLTSHSHLLSINVWPAFWQPCWFATLCEWEVYLLCLIKLALQYLFQHAEKILYCSNKYINKKRPPPLDLDAVALFLP